MPSEIDLNPADLERILARAAEASGIDFASYRVSTMKRRAALRVAMTGSLDANAYLELLDRDSAELQALVDALLIKTTWMYREPQTFAFLRARALPELFAQRATEGARSIRAWVPACASGEEAYTLAMCLDEARKETGLDFSVIASDVSASSLEKVEAAIYPESAIAALPADLVARYLVLSAQGEARQARVCDELRSRVVVARHDALRSPRSAPSEAGVASFDIVSCRNLLVYLKTEAQDALTMRLLKTCLQDSLLVIGDSESLRTAASANAAPAHSLHMIEPKIPVFRVT